MHYKALATAVIAVGIAIGFFPVAKSFALTNVPKNTVVVAQGDTLSSIAKNTNITFVRLFDANQNITNPDLIYPGETLTIPGPNDQLPDRYTSYENSLVATTSEQTPEASNTANQISQVNQTSNQTVTSSSGTVWDKIAACESSGNWAANTGNGYYGGLQFTLQSWESVGGTGYPNQASPSEQMFRASLLQARQGWAAWPVCSIVAGLR